MKVTEILNESNAYETLLDHMMEYLHSVGQTARMAPDQTMAEFEQHVIPGLIKDLKKRTYYEQK